MNHDIERSRLLLDAARIAAGAQQYPRGTLYVVATPIGNLADLTLRAIHVLDLVDAVACEDTRVTAMLLRHLGLERTLITAERHREREVAHTLVERLKAGERIALVSDAGTPVVSDPGARIVAAVRDAGLRCVPIPGPSAAVAALSAAGDVGGDDGFQVIGFAPARGRARLAAVQAVLDAAITSVFYESPHRIATFFDELARLAPERAVTVARELTKQFEEIATMPAQALPAWLAGDANRARGEFVVVVHAKARDDGARDDQGDAARDRLLRVLLAELPLKQAVDMVSAATDASRKQVYARALELRGQQDAVDNGDDSG